MLVRISLMSRLNAELLSAYMQIESKCIEACVKQTVCVLLVSCVKAILGNTINGNAQLKETVFFLSFFKGVSNYSDQLKIILA